MKSLSPTNVARNSVKFREKGISQQPKTEYQHMMMDADQLIHVAIGHLGYSK